MSDRTVTAGKVLMAGRARGRSGNLGNDVRIRRVLATTRNSRSLRCCARNGSATSPRRRCTQHCSMKAPICARNATCTGLGMARREPPQKGPTQGGVLTPDRFKVVVDMGKQIGEKAGQMGVRVVVSNDGKIITAFPVKP